MFTDFWFLFSFSWDSLGPPFCAAWSFFSSRSDCALSPFVSFRFISLPLIFLSFSFHAFHVLSFSFHVLSFPFIVLSCSFHVPFSFLSCPLFFLSFPFIFLSFSVDAFIFLSFNFPFIVLSLSIQVPLYNLLIFPFMFLSFSFIFLSQLEYSKCMVGIPTVPLKNQQMSTQLLEPNFRLFWRKPRYSKCWKFIVMYKMDGTKLVHKIGTLVHSMRIRKT